MLLLILVLALVILPSRAQLFGNCSTADIIAECDDKNRTCTKESILGNEFCGDCKDGFVLDLFSSDLGCVDELNLPVVDDVYDTSFDLCTSTDLIAQCTAQNRTCIRAATGAEKCDQCLNRFIPDFLIPEDCISIGDLSYDDYLQVFKPLFGLDLGLGVRLALLKAIASVVSFHNSHFPPPRFFLAINGLSAASAEEIAHRNGYRFNGSEVEGSIPFFDFNNTRKLQQTLPDAINWATEGAVTSVKDQGLCGCCWAISVIGAVEANAAINSNFGYRENLSFQQLISCDWGNWGCDGGLLFNAWQYVLDNAIGGLATYEDYPFQDYYGDTSTSCSADADLLAVTVPSAFWVTTETSPYSFADRIDYMKWAVSKQPVSVLMNSNCQLFLSYVSGLFTADGACACSDETCLSHAVLLVGYNDTAPIPYWTYKNSWGTSWGQGGYFFVAQTASDTMPWGLFGLLAQGSFPADAYGGTTVGRVESTSAATRMNTGAASAAVIAMGLNGW
jgi:hypothetical protein